MRLKLFKLLFLPTLFCLIFATALIEAWHWDFRTKLAPVIFAGIGFFAVVMEIASNMAAEFKKGASGNDLPDEGPAFADTKYEDMDFGTGLRRAGWFFIYIFGFLLGIVLLGFHVTVPVFAFLYLKIEGKASWFLAVSIAAALLAFLVLVFDWLLNVPWPDSLLMRLLQR